MLNNTFVLVLKSNCTKQPLESNSASPAETLNNSAGRLHNVQSQALATHMVKVFTSFARY